jgi:hypothetical protein
VHRASPFHKNSKSHNKCEDTYELISNSRAGTGPPARTRWLWLLFGTESVATDIERLKSAERFAAPSGIDKGQSWIASESSRSIRCNLLCYAARIAIAHPTTASAIRMQVAVKAFSKADEGIVMLSFAYPGEMFMRFRRRRATARRRMSTGFNRPRR